mgnify:CR=1 FL=1
MQHEELYELVHDAVTAAIERQLGGRPLRIARRLVGGRLLFEDAQGREVRAVPNEQVFKKVTAIREKLRVLEQKLNNHPTLTAEDKAEYQDLLTRCYGSLTTFNFFFEDEDDRFKGSGG